MKHVWAKLLGWGQLALALVTQASNGHFPQNRNEWLHLLESAIIAAALHHAASTDGQK